MDAKIASAEAQDKAAEEAEAVAAPRFQRIISAAMLFAIEEYEFSGRLVLPDTYKSEIEIALADAWGRSGRLVGQFVIGQFKDGFPHLEKKEAEESFFQRVLREFIERYGVMRVTQISTATVESMQRVIGQGLANGETIAEIAKRLRDSVPLISWVRAHVIARTETHSAGQHANLEVARSARITLVKEWVSSGDSRTRDFGEGNGVVDKFSHRAMNGVRAALDSPFSVPKIDGSHERLMMPGDPHGSPANVINCRCAQVFEKV